LESFIPKKGRGTIAAQRGFKKTLGLSTLNTPNSKGNTEHLGKGIDSFCTTIFSSLPDLGAFAKRSSWIEIRRPFGAFLHIAVHIAIMSLFGSLQTTATSNPSNPFGGSLAQPQQNQIPQQSTFGTSTLFNQSQAPQQQQQQQQQQQPQQPQQQAFGSSILNISQNQQRPKLWEPGQDSPSTSC
jgi:hypothetical protein